MTTHDSISAKKDHFLAFNYFLAFNLAKSVCLLADMERHENLTELKVIRSTTKSMILVKSEIRST